MTKGDSMASLAKNVATVAIIVSMVAVLSSLMLNFYYNPERVARRTFESMSRDYYEDYFYDKFLESVQNVEADFGKYIETGFAPVLLRQLLIYGADTYPNARMYFDNARYTCDENSTMAVFRPVAPYGKTDYEMTITMACLYE